MIHKIAKSDASTSNGDLTRQVRTGAVWSIASTLLIRLSGIAIMAVVVRIVTPREFGVFAIAVAIHAIVASVGELGVASYLVRGDVEPEDYAPTVAAISITSSVVLSITMAILASLLSQFLGSSDAVGPIRVMALAVLLVGVFAVPSAQLERDFKQRRLFMATVAGFVPSNAALVFMAMNGDGAMAFAWSRVIGQLVVGTIITMSVRPHYLPAVALQAVRPLLRFGVPLAGANLINYTLLNADYMLVGRWLGTVQLGTYMLAFSVASWSTTLLSSMINSVVIPAISRVRHDSLLFDHSLFRGSRIIALVAVPIAALTVPLSAPLVMTIYGEKWIAAAPVLSILSLYGVVFIMCLLFSNILVGVGRTRVLFVVQFIWIACLVPALAVGANLAGIVGIALAHVMVIAGLVLPLYVNVLRRSAGADLRALARSVCPPVVAGLAAGAVAYVVSGVVGAPVWKLVLGGGTGGMIYAFAMAPLAVPFLGDRLAHSWPVRILVAPSGLLPYGRASSLLSES